MLKLFSSVEFDGEVRYVRILPSFRRYSSGNKEKSFSSKIIRLIFVYKYNVFCTMKHVFHEIVCFIIKFFTQDF